MRYVSINSVPNGSTGAVMRQVTEERRALGDECWCMWGRGRPAENSYEYNFGSKPELYLDVLQTRLDGKAGFHSKLATRRLLEKLDEIEPDIVHLHNIHGYYVNVEMLFDWLSTHENVQVKWTLHDCWPFTGHCVHFQYVGCDRWKDGACDKSCPQLNTYPKTISKRSPAWSFIYKKKTFTKLPPDHLTLVTPSNWLGGLVKDSFLSKYPVEVRNNSIDKKVFKPTLGDFRSQYGIGDRFMILGVASPWTERKGLPCFQELAERLDSAEYAVVIVGLGKRQIKKLSSNLIRLERTESPHKLAEIYTAADVFFNPTCEDNYPTVNLEAEACGTPVITFDTGGCGETVHDTRSSVVTNLDEAISAVLRLRSNEPYNRIIA